MLHHFHFPSRRCALAGLLVATLLAAGCRQDGAADSEQDSAAASPSPQRELESRLTAAKLRMAAQDRQLAAQDRELAVERARGDRIYAVLIAGIVLAVALFVAGLCLGSRARDDSGVADERAPN